MKLTQILLGSAIALSSAMAYSADWISVGEAKDKSLAYIDVDSIEYHRFTSQAGGYLTAWVKFDYTTARKASNGKLYRQAKVFNYFDCQNKQLKLEQEILYTSQGSYVDSWNGYVSTSSSESWKRVIPESVGEGLLDTACSYYNNTGN